MRLERKARKLKSSTMEDVILFHVQGVRLAIAANAVDEIRNLDGLTALKTFGPKLAKVRFTLVREKKDREKQYFVVDAAAHFKLPAAKGTRVLVLRDSSVAILVEGIDRMSQVATVHPLPKAFHGDECSWYRGLAVSEETIIPVVEPESFLSRGEVAVLQANARTALAAQATGRGAATA